MALIYAIKTFKYAIDIFFWDTNSCIFYDNCWILAHFGNCEYDFSSWMIVFNRIFTYIKKHFVKDLCNSSDLRMDSADMNRYTFFFTSSLNGFTVAPYFPLRMSFVSFVAIL